MFICTTYFVLSPQAASLKSLKSTVCIRNAFLCFQICRVTKCSQSVFGYIIIVVVIWHYNPLSVFAFSAKSLQVLLSLAVSFQFLTFSFFRSSITSSCHRYLGLPTGLIPIGFQSSSFLVGLAWSIL